MTRSTSVAEDDLVVTRFTSKGTHCYVYGRRAHEQGTRLDRHKHRPNHWGQDSGELANWDMMGMMQQLGAISSLERSSEEASPT